MTRSAWDATLDGNCGEVRRVAPSFPMSRLTTTESSLAGISRRTHKGGRDVVSKLRE
jgi:hypothetical protein